MHIVPERSRLLDVRMQYDSISRERVRFILVKGDSIVIHDSINVTEWRVRVDSFIQHDTVPEVVEVTPPLYYIYRRSTFTLAAIVLLLTAIIVTAIVLRVRGR